MSYFLHFFFHFSHKIRAQISEPFLCLAPFDEWKFFGQWFLGGDGLKGDERVRKGRNGLEGDLVRLPPIEIVPIFSHSATFEFLNSALVKNNRRFFEVHAFEYYPIAG